MSTKTTTEPLHQTLRRIRKEQERAANQVAGTIGVTPAYFNDMELGRRPVHPKHLIKWAAALDQDPCVIAACLLTERVDDLVKIINLGNKTGRKLSFEIKTSYK